MKSTIAVLLFIPLALFSQWEKQIQLQGYGRHIVMFDSLNGYAATSEALFKTIDGWQSFIRMTSGFHIRGFAVSNAGGIACSGVDMNSIQMGYRVSHDGGQTWISNTYPTMEGHSNIIFLSEDTLVAHGDRVTTNISYDGGKSWNPWIVDSSKSFWATMIKGKNGEVFISTHISKTLKWSIQKADRRYNTWQNLGAIEDGPRDFILVGNKVYASGGYGNFFIGDENFTNWQTIETSFNHPLANLYFLDEQNGFVCGGKSTKSSSYGVILRTKDAGKSWQNTQIVGYEREVTDLSFIDNNIGFAIDYAGNIFKTTNAGGPAIPDTIVLQPNEQDTATHNPKETTHIESTDLSDPLNVIVYPNPGNEVLNVQLQGTSIETGKIELRDIRGRILSVYTIDRDLLEINTSRLSSGMYFLHFDTTEGSFLRRWVKE